MISMTATIPNMTAAAGRIIPTQQDMIDVALESRRIIIERTRGGVDMNGQGFAGYSEDYKDYRSKKGRQTEPVNLTFHNRMLGSMMVKRYLSDGAQIYFADAERRIVAWRHNEGIGVPQRRFFGMSENEFKGLIDKLAAKLRGRAR